MAWTDQQLAAAAEFMQANIDNPAAIAQRRDELGLTNDDLLQAAQTVNQGITMGGVQQFLGETPRAPVPPQQQTYRQNPYLDQIAQGITQQTTRNLNEQIMPGIRSQAIAAGGFGDARHGVAEGLAIGRTNDALTNSLANLYGSDYNNAQNRNLQQYLGEMQNQLGYAGLDTQRYGIDANNATQRYGVDTNAATSRYGTDANNATQRYGIDQTYSLGQTNAANNRYGIDKNYEVGMAGANASMANAQANQAVAQGNLTLGQQRLGADLTLGLLDRQMGYNNNGITMGTNIQNTPANTYDRFNQQANSMGQGFATNTQTQQGGGTDPLMGVAGIARMGQSWLNQSQPVASNNNVYFGNGSMAD